MLRLYKGTLLTIALYVSADVAYHTLANHSANNNTLLSQKILKGRTLAQECAACHMLEENSIFVGPPLVNILNRPTASIRSYEYSDAMKRIGGKWNKVRLAEFLANPQKFAPGTKMTAAGWEPSDIENLISYFENQN